MNISSWMQRHQGARKPVALHDSAGPVPLCLPLYQAPLTLPAFLKVCGCSCPIQCFHSLEEWLLVVQQSPCEVPTLHITREGIPKEQRPSPVADLHTTEGRAGFCTFCTTPQPSFSSDWAVWDACCYSCSPGCDSRRLLSITALLFF